MAWRMILAGAMFTSVAAAQQDRPNFYLPDAEVTATPVPTPVRPAETPAPTPRTIERETPKFSERINVPAGKFTAAEDPFGLVHAFEIRWDFSWFLMSVQEELRFRIDAARARTLRLARAFSALSSEVEIRQRNLNAAALAAYLLSRDQATFNPLGGRNLTDSQMLAVRITMTQDMDAMDDSLRHYEALRHALNASADHAERLEKQGLAASPYNALAGEDRPTLPLNLVARAQTEAVLQERVLDDAALEALLAADFMRTTGEARQSIAAFAPPPPEDLSATPSPYEYTTVDPVDQVDPADTQRPPRWPGTDLVRPEQTATVFPVEVNAPLYAVRKGVVAYAGPFRGYGVMVIMEHENDVFSVYSHLASINVRERETIDQGNLIGRAGSVPELGSPGVHFQVRRGKDPIAPAEWLQADLRQALLRQ